MRISILLALASGLSAQTYEIRPAAGTRFALEVAKTGLMSGKKHLFVFERYGGTIQYDAAAPEKSAVDLTIESASIVCKDTWIGEKDLRKVTETAIGPDMLEVSKHPQMQFRAAGASKSGDGFVVQGTLTIRGIAKPVTVNVTVKPRPDGSLEFAGKSEVKLRDYGLKPPSAALGAIGTKNEMPVDFNLAAVRK